MNINICMEAEKDWMGTGERGPPEEVAILIFDLLSDSTRLFSS